jgi:hypothetical protein
MELVHPVSFDFASTLRSFVSGNGRITAEKSQRHFSFANEKLLRMLLNDMSVGRSRSIERAGEKI